MGMVMFYLALRMLDVVLFTLGSVLNLTDKRMLLLTVAVGTSVLFPIQPTSIAVFWYAQCFLIEIGVTILCLAISAGLASRIVVVLGMTLSGLHIIAMTFGPQHGISLYRVLVPIFEISQLLTCIILSAPVMDLIRAVKYPERKIK